MVYIFTYYSTPLLNSQQWRAKSLDGNGRSSSSSSLNTNVPKLIQQPVNHFKLNHKDLQKPLTIHIDYQLPSSSSSSMSRVFRTISSTSSTTNSSSGGRDTPSSLHVPSGNVMKANSVCSHGQRRLSKRYYFVELISYHYFRWYTENFYLVT